MNVAIDRNIGPLIGWYAHYGQIVDAKPCAPPVSSV